jgi:transcriptional regulator with XRE-family HTH domain
MSLDLSPGPAARPESDAVGPLLRAWRERRRLSQLELSSRAEVSTRHLSYVETGRSRPTPQMILRIAEQLDVPLAERNRLLLAGGYAPAYTEGSLDDQALEPVMTSLRHLLDAHLPYPALLLDETWDVVDANEAVHLLLTGCDPELLEPPINAMRLTFHPGGLAGRIGNLDLWAARLLTQLHARADHTGHPRLQALAEEMTSYVGPLPPVSGIPAGPVLTVDLAPAADAEAGAPTLRFFSMAARLETANDTTLAGLHLETFLPADAATASALRGAG